MNKEDMKQLLNDNIKSNEECIHEHYTHSLYELQEDITTLLELENTMSEIQQLIKDRTQKIVCTIERPTLWTLTQEEKRQLTHLQAHAQAFTSLVILSNPFLNR